MRSCVLAVSLACGLVVPACRGAESSSAAIDTSTKARFLATQPGDAKVVAKTFRDADGELLGTEIVLARPVTIQGCTCTYLSAWEEGWDCGNLVAPCSVGRYDFVRGGTVFWSWGSARPRTVMLHHLDGMPATLFIDGLACTDAFELYPNGRLAECVHTAPVTVDGKTYPAGTLELDPGGRVLRHTPSR